jgi:hypothetical protein
VIVASSEHEMQRAVYVLNNMAIKHNLKISVNDKNDAMKVKKNVKTKTVLNNHVT